MRIGLASVDFFPNVGGVAAHVAELGRALVRQGHHVDVFTVPRSGHREEVSTFDGMTVHRPRVLNRKPFYSWMMARWLRSFLAEHPLDVLHVHGLRPLEASRVANVPVVFTNHTSGFLKRVESGALERARLLKRLQHVQHVIAPSPERVEAVRQIGYPGPVQFIANGVDPQVFSPGDATLPKGIVAGDEEIVVLFPARMVEVKGVLVFANAVAKLKSQKSRFIVAGDGPLKGEVARIVRAGGAGDRVHFLGRVAADQMPKLYRAADFAILPSFMEATSIAALESMATARPVIASRVGGLVTLIRDGETGLLVEPGDADALAAAIDRLTADASLRREMGAAARTLAVEQFSWTRIAQETVQVYSQLARRAA
ncbi:MAG: glycosyltransferase family 4 protein [Planctomycetota bacterium]|jgi:glycosyltransferase involved in cell wall biosynthesis